ncbi:MAG: N-acetyltransferase, partial [Bryobacteraceae bacterium]
MENTTLILGDNCHVEEPAMLGRTYLNWREPLRIGDHAIIRPYAVIYCDTTIGEHFQCGYFCVIRAECKLADRVTLMSRVTLEGRVEIGEATKIMAHVYLPSKTKIGSRVFIGPGVTVLNDRYPFHRERSQTVVQGPTIEDSVMVGGGCTLFPGIRIG